MSSTITDINQARAERAKSRTGEADQLDRAVAIGLLVSAAQMHLSAQYLLDTGRIDQAKKVAEAAELTHAVYRDVVPAAQPRKI